MKGKSSFENEEIIQMVFDSFCKRVLKNAAINCFHEIKRHREREQFFSELTKREWQQIYMEDEYRLESHVFQVMGQEVEVKNFLIAKALRHLPEKKRNVILMYYYLEMTESEIAEQMDLGQSTINYHRMNSLKELEEFLEVHKDDI
mgnify:CR=1 FL=1